MKTSEHYALNSDDKQLLALVASIVYEISY